MFKVALGSFVAIAFVLAAVSSASGQEADIRIAQLECTGDPELVVIENRGDAAQALAGWKLQSDPPDTEVFDLTVLGGLQPGASVFIRSGPSASGVFQWGLEFVFRDNDPTDYARIVDATGAVVDQVNCPGGAAPEPSPTPSPEPSPTPSPEPTPAAEVPNGGGPPPPSGDALSAAMMVIVGGSLAAAGVVTGALSWLHRRPWPMVGRVATGAAAEVAARSDARPRRAAGSASGAATLTIGLVLLGLLVAAVALLMLEQRPQ